MKKNIFKKAGLTDVQSEIYSFLLENGAFKASEIAKKIKRPRGVVYKGLDELILLKLVEKIENSGITRFQADHPGNLEKVLYEKEKNTLRDISEQKNKLEIDKKSLLSAMPDFISMFNLNQSKPGVRYFEGLEGVEFILNDTLTSKTDIYTYIDTKDVHDEITELNDNYVKRRIEKGIMKKIITPENNRALTPMPEGQFTKTKYLSNETPMLKTAMQIYDGKISYQTFTENKMIAVLIEDENIYSFHKILFENLWSNL